MNISIWPGSRLYRFLPVCLLVIFCLGCSTTPKSMFEMDGEPLDSGITLEPEQRINIYTKDKRIVSMDGHKINAKNIEGKLLVIDSGNVNGYFAVFEMEEVKSITVGDVEPTKPSNFTLNNVAYYAEGTLCILVAIATLSYCEGMYFTYEENYNDNVEWVTQYDNKVEGDYKIAFKWYQQAADQGDPIAMTNLGSMYTEGRGVAKDEKTALEWYELAAAHGIAEAQLVVLRIKAEQGNAHAQNDLGNMYESGRGVSQDYEAALKWYKLATEQGHADAHTRLLAVRENAPLLY